MVINRRQVDKDGGLDRNGGISRLDVWALCPNLTLNDDPQPCGPVVEALRSNRIVITSKDAPMTREYTASISREGDL